MDNDGLPRQASGKQNDNCRLGERSSAGAPRNASVTLADSVVGWSPHEVDTEAGFPVCSRFVLGNKPQPVLLPGDAMLIAIDVLAPLPPPPLAAGMENKEKTAHEMEVQEATRKRWALT